MMSVEQQAKALADWLAQNPGAEPPEGVDADVIEAVYSLRPDLAPAPRVSIDDILGMVSSGPLAAPVAPVDAPVTPPEASDVPVSSVPKAVVTPTPANNNRRLWAVLGGVAALAAAVLVTVQVSMNAGQVSSAPQMSEPEVQTRAPQLAQGPARDMAPGAARQQDKAETIAAIEAPEALDADNVFDAVADLGYAGGEEEFELDDGVEAAPELAGLLRDERDLDARTGGQPVAEPEREPNDTTSHNARLAWEDGEASDGDMGDRDGFGTLGVVGGSTTASGSAGLDGNENRVTARPRPAPTPAPSPARGPDAASPATTVATNTPPPVEPAFVRPDAGGGDDFLDAAVADAEEDYYEEQLQEVETRASDDAEGYFEMDEVVVAESTSRRRERGGRRAQRGAAAPSADVPRQEQAAPAEQAPPADAAPAPAAGAMDRQFAGVELDAGVAQAQQRARAFADQQQYSSAFDTLSGYISPSAPVQVVLDATEYAFAAGRWSDTVRVASIRLNANVPSDSAQQRSRLYDYRARAQAMLDERVSAPSMMSAEPAE